jgi:poly(A)-specific ribonuclease
VDVPGTAPPMGASPSDVYYAKRIAVENYTAFQMGIALFTKVGNDAYEVRPYNFYLLKSDGDLQLSLSAIAFLAANNMNFQTWLTSGLAFCSEQEELEYEAKKELVFTGEGEQYAVDQLIAAADECLLVGGEPLTRQLSCTSDLARRLKCLVERHSDYRVSATYDGKPYLAQQITFTLKKLDEVEWAAEKEKKERQKELERGQTLGFRQFWKILVNNKKPVVGHNFMQDTMFMFHMHQEPLPKDYSAFKQQLQKHLPVIYDTKTIARKLSGDSAFQITHLGAVYDECRRRAGLSQDKLTRKFHLPPGFYNYNDEAIKAQNKAHEAAYDAYMTGIAFCVMRDLYPQATIAAKNVISAFGSVYYMCVDGPDQLVNPSTFVLESDVPCYSEHIESLFFATEEKSSVAKKNDKIDVRKLSYSVNGLVRCEDTKKFTSFCVRMNTPASAEQVHERIQSLREKPLTNGENVNLELLFHITVRNI